MKEGPDIARLASLIGDLARANMLTALMDGRALTASELAQIAGVSLPTASGHLTKLSESALVTPRKEGRHKYFQLADGDVAATLEALMGLAETRGARSQRQSGSHTRSQTGPRDAAMREARSCYQHLAGRMGVQMYHSLLARGYLAEAEGEVSLTPQGHDFMEDFGIDMEALTAGRATLCRSCLDWSERKAHLSGSLGRALFSRMEILGWLRRDPKTRHVRFSHAGKAAFTAMFPDLSGAGSAEPDTTNVVRGRFPPPRRVSNV